MHTVIVLYLLILLTSAASADVYTWEDANGLNFTDNSSSVPEKYREKPAPQSNPQSGNTNSQVRAGMYRQNRPVAVQENRAEIQRADPEHHRRAAESKKQRQINARNLESTLQSLAKFIVIGIMLGFCLFVVWIVTIVDIARGEFITPSHKAVWMLLVFFLPLIGMLLYIMLGSHQKNDPASCRGKHRPELPARSAPGESKIRHVAID